MHAWSQVPSGTSINEQRTNASGYTSSALHMKSPSVLCPIYFCTNCMASGPRHCRICYNTCKTVRQFNGHGTCMHLSVNHFPYILKNNEHPRCDDREFEIDEHAMKKRNRSCQGRLWHIFPRVFRLLRLFCIDLKLAQHSTAGLTFQNN